MWHEHLGPQLKNWNDNEVLFHILQVFDSNSTQWPLLKIHNLKITQGLFPVHIDHNKINSIG